MDPKLFDARDGESHAKTIARIIKERFYNLISVNGQQIQINKTTNREWVRSESATHLSDKQPSLYIDKLKTISNADEILKAAKNWIGEKPKHARKDDIIEFARGEVYYRVGSNGYVADALVGIRKNGAAVLYDLKNIYEKEITDTSLAMAGQSPQRSEDVSVKDNISQPETEVKDKYSRQLNNTADNIEQLISFYVTKKHNKKGSQSVPPATQGSLSGGARLPDNSVPQKAQSDDNDDMQNEKKDAKKYSVKRDVDGNKFVDADPDLFDVRDGESHAKTIARIIKDRFNNLSFRERAADSD